jgi:hypothetical protein
MWCRKGHCNACHCSLHTQQYGVNRLPPHTIQLCELKEAFEKKMVIVADIEFLNGECSNEMVAKELALYNSNCIQMYQFQPPYTITGKQWDQVRKSNKWIREYLNGFSWYDGQVQYWELKRILGRITCLFPVILTKGLQKRNFIWGIVGGKNPDVNVVNLEDFDCPSFKHINDTAQRCQFHSAKSRENYQCAVEKAGKFFNWVQQKLGDKDE